jgi:signal peptidase I
MDFNLPLLLMVAVGLTGLVWILDAIFWSRPRARGVSQVEEKFAALSIIERQQNASYQAELMSAKREPSIVEYSKSFFPILAIVFVLRSFLIEPFKIPSESMVPTLEVGDFIAVNKFAYGIRLPVFGTKIFNVADPKRGDVVVFFPPHEDRYFIKRLVGLPGDEIRYRDNELYINGVHIEQQFINDDPQYRSGSPCYGDSYRLLSEHLGEVTHIVRKCSALGRSWNNKVWTVPEGHYFMMGDNRDNSLDSRAWHDPFVPDKNIVGKAFAIWMHWNDGLPSLGRSGSIK